jgi:hypothetical protein
MNIKAHTLVLAGGLAMALTSASTLAQVAPPPTKPAQEKPAYTPPPKPTPAATPKSDKPATTTTTPATTTAAPKPTTTGNVRKRDRGDIQDLPTDVWYPKLAVRGPDDRILRLRQLPDIAALKSNHTVGEKSVEKIMPIVYSRRYKFELMVIDNLDLYWELTGGLIKNLNMTDLNEMSRAAEMLKPLVAPTTLSQELTNRGILTRVQGGMNQYIVQEYKRAVTDEIQVLSPDNGLEEVMRFVLDDSIHEASLTYDALLAEAMPQIGSLVKETGATSAEATALVALEKSLNEDQGQQFVDLQAFDVAFRTLTFDEATAILSAMREKREFPSLSPMISKINVLHDRKIMMKDGAMNGIIEDKTGRVINTKEREEARKLEQDNKQIDNKEDPEG